MYRVNEIFYSLQGEGAFTGTPMIFVRFSGCNRSCPFCDTDFKSYMEFTVQEIISKCRKYPARRVVLTGGEPLLQVDRELVDKLHDAGFVIHVETNGTLPVPQGIDWVTCSPKDREPEINTDCVDEVKIVYTGQSESELENIRNRFVSTKLFYLQPCSCKNTAETVAQVLKLKDWRLSLQTHKLINIP